MLFNEGVGSFQQKDERLKTWDGRIRAWGCKGVNNQRFEKSQDWTVAFCVLLIHIFRNLTCKVQITCENTMYCIYYGMVPYTQHHFVIIITANTCTILRSRSNWGESAQMTIPCTIVTLEPMGGWFCSQTYCPVNIRMRIIAWLPTTVVPLTYIVQ